MTIQKPCATSAEQNKQSILEVLRELLVDGDLVVELGSGTGQHACYFARAMQGIAWQPTELRSMLPVIRLWLEDEGSDNIRPPLELDVNEADWGVTSSDVVYTANTLHIISKPAIESLFAGVGRLLTEGGRFCAYGPFKFSGEHTSPSNAAFDQQLRDQDPRSGVRDIAWLNTLAQANGLLDAELIEMPANNFIAVWHHVKLN